MSMLPPVTEDARLIKALYDLVFWLAVGVFVLVEGLLIYSVIRFRRRRADELPLQVHGNRTLELIWTIVPSVLIAIVFGLAVDTMTRMTARGTLANPVAHVHAIGDQQARRRVEAAQPVDMVIEVIGRQWVWQYRYPGGDVITTEELVVPANKNIRLDMTAADVIHAWWMPQLGPMIYVNPGEMSYVWFNVPPGEYVGQCNVYCGVAHANMIARVRALPQAEFDEWFAQQSAAASVAVEPGDPERGRNYFMNSACVACHYIEGTKAQGKVAPRDLTRFATYPTIAQVDGLENNAENLRRWLKDPQSLKPGTAMPNLNLKAQDVEDLVAYLLTLR
ncbi:MAG: cytochrome c oxidase subunit II [Thermoflexales bacterium]|nr:cytochrome c oxidase subunit II [Thermoflexales bacterium]MCS7323744.1 cytochrome c oxidase subunit II [Thermoflexales bacterium]MDW8054736.1 cytochrome c oxidase subunit II [Anaerolineae bacterium]MDW8292555.1 cytochrome c oxidase subunit II [Anaerolineae bacterium]